MIEYRCDGMPTLAGCNGTIEISRPYVRPGKKASGWLVTPALVPNSPDSPLDDPSQWHDGDELLTFCPECAVVVEQQIAQQRADA